MTSVYLNTLILMEMAVCLGLLAFIILVKTGLFEWGGERADFLVTLNGPLIEKDLIFEFTPTSLVYDMKAGNGCLASDLNFLAGQSRCIRQYCSGRIDDFDMPHVHLQMGHDCIFTGVLRFVGAGLGSLAG